MNRQKYNGLNGLLKSKLKYNNNGRLKNNKEENKNLDKKILTKIMNLKNKTKKDKKK